MSQVMVAPRLESIASNYSGVVPAEHAILTREQRSLLEKLDVIEAILKVLGKKKELSVKAISEEVRSQWETTIKALEFMKKIRLVKERQGKKTHKTERLFSLVKAKT